MVLMLDSHHEITPPPYPRACTSKAWGATSCRICDASWDSETTPRVVENGRGHLGVWGEL